MPHGPLTPAMRSVLERMARLRRAPLHTMPPHEARVVYAAAADVLEVPQAELHRVEDFSIAARDGYAMAARVYSNAGLPPPPFDKLRAGQASPSGGGGEQPVLLFLHGGGFTIGGIGTHDILCRQLCLLGGCAVVSLDYRLAPEHRFPQAVDDAWDALQWLHAHGSAIGIDPARIAVGGDSAGGTLAAVCAIQARGAGLPLALQLLFYPGTAAAADAHDLPSRAHFREGLLLDETLIDYFFAHYIEPHARGDWRFAPLNAPDVEGVAPAWFGLAECDPLVDEGIAYADKLRAAGVPVQLEIYRGVVHEFIKMGRAIPEARQAHADAGRALAAAFETDTP